MDDHELTKEEANDLHVVLRILRVLIFSYIIGWVILIVNVGNIPLLNGLVWELGAVICLVSTFWLGITLSLKALRCWVVVVMIYTSLRSFAYGVEGIFNPLGVWLLVLTGVSITALAVISVKALTGRLEPHDIN